MEELKLKPCPFCGKKVEVGNANANAFLIWCRSCEIGTTNFPSRKSAIKAWNTRKPSDEVSEGE